MTRRSTNRQKREESYGKWEEGERKASGQHRVWMKCCADNPYSVHHLYSIIHSMKLWRKHSGTPKTSYLFVDLKVGSQSSLQLKTWADFLLWRSSTDHSLSVFGENRSFKLSKQFTPELQICPLISTFFIFDMNMIIISLQLLDRPHINIWKSDFY